MDSAWTENMEKNRIVLNNRNVAHNPIVIEWRRIPEEDRVLTVNHKTGNVEGSKVNDRTLVRPVVTSTGEMVEARRNIHQQLAVDQDIQLAHTIVEIVKVEARESQQHGPTT